MTYYKVVSIDQRKPGCFFSSNGYDAAIVKQYWPDRVTYPVPETPLFAFDSKDAALGFLSLKDRKVKEYYGWGNYRIFSLIVGPTAEIKPIHKAVDVETCHFHRAMARKYWTGRHPEGFFNGLVYGIWQHSVGIWGWVRLGELVE